MTERFQSFFEQAMLRRLEGDSFETGLVRRIYEAKSMGGYDVESLAEVAASGQNQVAYTAASLLATHPGFYVEIGRLSPDAAMSFFISRLLLERSPGVEYPIARKAFIRYIEAPLNNGSDLSFTLGCWMAHYKSQSQPTDFVEVFATSLLRGIDEAEIMSPLQTQFHLPRLGAIELLRTFDAQSPDQTEVLAAAVLMDLSRGDHAIGPDKAGSIGSREQLVAEIVAIVSKSQSAPALYEAACRRIELRLAEPKLLEGHRSLLEIYAKRLRAAQAETTTSPATEPQAN